MAAEANHAFDITEVIKLSTLYSQKASTILKHLLRLYYYLRAKIKLSPYTIIELIYLDIKYSVILIDRAFLKV